MDSAFSCQVFALLPNYCKSSRRLAHTHPDSPAHSQCKGVDCRSFFFQVFCDRLSPSIAQFTWAILHLPINSHLGLFTSFGLTSLARVHFPWTALTHAIQSVSVAACQPHAALPDGLILSGLTSLSIDSRSKQGVWAISSIRARDRT